MRRFASVAVFVSSIVLAAPAFPANTGVKSYQVTGPVLEMTDTTVTVQKGKEKWVIAKDAATKTTGDLKVGAKVTVYYSMTAQEIEAKAEKPSKKAKK